MLLSGRALVNRLINKHMRYGLCNAAHVMRALINVLYSFRRWIVG